MKIPRQPTRLAAVMAVFFCLLFFSVDISFGQSGPPMPPIIFLNSYSFLTTNWTSDIGDYSPISFTNLVSVSNWGGNALRLDRTNLVPAYLRYHIEETNGFLNFDSGAGAVYALIVPDWASSNSTQHGHGPGSDAYVLAAGDWSTGSPNGFWGIYINSGGTNIYFTGVSNSVVTNYVSAPISWASNSLHLISLLYSTNTKLFLDGKLAATGGPVKFEPNTNTWTNGFYVGSDDLGYEQFRGDFLYLEFDTTNVTPYMGGTNYYNDDWPYMTNNYYTWLDGGSGGSDDGMGGGFIPPAPIPATNYADYNQFFLAISNSRSSVNVTVSNTLSNLTYEVQTNSNISQSNGWGVWQTFVATNSVTPMPSLALGSNCLFFRALLDLSTTTNGLPDYWCMEYFRTLNVNPYADPDGDGLCNRDEYVLGLNPTNAHTLSTFRTDAQALVLAYTNNYAGCVYHLTVTNGPNTNILLVTMSPTVIGTNYQIYSQASTNGPWIVETNFLGTNTSTTVAIYLNGRTLSLIGGYGEDSDGDELPDGYEVLATHTDPYLPDTGLTGTPDTYKDPDGDGYVNIVEYYNGTDPLVFNAPAGAQNLVADWGSTSNTYNLSWQASGGPVSEYVITVNGALGQGWVTVATNSSTSLSYILNNASNYTSVFFITSIFTNGTRVTNYSYNFDNQHYAVAQAAMAYGPGGKAYLVTSAANTNITGFTLPNIASDNEFPQYPAYGQSQTSYTPTFPSSSSIPISQFTNGVAALTSTQVPPYSAINVDGFSLGVQGDNNTLWTTYSSGYGSLVPFCAAPFIDGRTNLNQNVNFLLRAAAGTAFSYAPDENGTYSYYYPTNYVFASYYYNSLGGNLQMDQLAPFEDNYFFANFVLNSSYVGNTGALDTGFDPTTEGYYSTSYYYPMYLENGGGLAFEFPSYSYIVNSNNATIPGQLSSAQTAFVGYYQEGGFESNYDEFGIYWESGNTYGMSNNALNLYGLPYNGLKMSYPGTPPQFATLSPGGNLSFNNMYAWFAGTAEPTLQTVGYYFANVLTDPLPQYSSFNVTNVTPLMLGSVGSTLIVAGFAKEAVLNGDTNVFAYVGQYFTNAFTTTNGVVTTNSAGILSEYGYFFPTVPGQVALITKPDPFQTNRQGTNILDIIRLSLDVNHDGFVDETFTGPDNTGPNAPYTFWLNNDFDRWTSSTLDGNVEDDVQSNSVDAGSPYEPTLSVPDCQYRASDGQRGIPCARDLEDFARLWVSGVSNALPLLPAGSTVTLSWQNNSGVTIDLFQAADTNGGIGYLTNLTTASNQINTNLCRYIGRLGPGDSIQLNSSTYSNDWAGNYYIWCGVAQGSDQLNLTITDSGNQLAQSSQYIQIVDIKQMYERWTVGDNDKNVTPFTPMTVPVQVEDGQPTCQYSYDPAYDTNDNYVLFVHGYNMASWEKDRFAETAYKRLYWQGYQGRFGEFRWPTYNRFISYDTSETEAWNSGLGLENLLTSLNRLYPGNVYVLAHSMGNVVTGEALRLAGTNKLVNTYVASQAAVSARAYNNTIPADITNSIYFIVQTPDSEGHYYTNGAPSYFNSIGGAFNFVDFYNHFDWALGKWILDQGTKPDLGYGYELPSTNFPSGYWSKPYFVGNGIPLNFPTNTYQIFSRCVQSYSQALGAETNVASPFLIKTPVNLEAAPYNFLSTHPGHSEQFRFDNMTTAVYWNQLLSSFGIQP